MDRIQSKFLEDAGIDDVSALIHFNLAPLATRRDMAMLGILHRTVIGKGPPHFRSHFQVLANRTIKDLRNTSRCPLIKRSILGLVAIYNLLPEQIRDACTVKHFQVR